MFEHKYEEIKLKNGARGLLIDVPAASVMHAMVNFRAGDFLSPDGKWDTAHVLEHMMLGANEKYPKAREFQAELQKNGAYFNAFTTSFDITYVSECADFEWQRVLDLMLTAIEQPLFRDDEFNAEKGNVREELSGDLNEHFRQLMIAGRQAHGMIALPDGQRLVQLQDISNQDVKDHYERTHRSANMRFIIAGKIGTRKQKIIDRLEAVSLKQGRRYQLPMEKPQKLEDVLYVERSGVENIYFVINILANKTLKKAQDDSLEMLNTMLTSTLHSGILGEAREKGLAYSIASSHYRGRQLTDWWFGAQLLKDNSQKVFDIIVKHIDNAVLGKIKNHDVDAAKRYSLGKLKRSVQTVGSLARVYANRYFFDGLIENFSEFEPRIKAVSKQQMVDIAKHMINQNNWGLSVLTSEGETAAADLHRKIAVLWE